MHDQTEIAATELIQDLLRERRRDRRWKNIRFLMWFSLIAFTLFFFSSFPGSKKALPLTHQYVSLIRLEGMITAGREFSAEQVVPLLKEAFSDKDSKGVILDINSGGGTPVQAAIIHDAILHFKNKYHKKVVVVGEDLLTSGAYYVAVAADHIYVNPNTLTGSIGVVMKGFGFVEFMKKIGVERRVYVAGDQKDRLDPFIPQSSEDVKKIQQVMSEVHDNFMHAVLESRKGKLHADPAILFSGDFWSGQTALKLGLVDGLGNLTNVIEKEFGTSRYEELSSGSHFLKLFTNQMNTTMDKVLGL